MQLKVRLLDANFKMRDYRPLILENGKGILESVSRLEASETRSRKFIVLKNKQQNVEDEELYVVVGPEFVDEHKHPTTYMHADVRQYALHLIDKDNDKKLFIKGGGQIKFAWPKYGGSAWEATWSGQSMDYGAYDPSILLDAHMQALTNWIGMRSTFEWRDSRSPERKT